MTDMEFRFTRQIKTISTDGTEPQTEEEFLPEITGTPFHGMKITKTALL